LLNGEWDHKVYLWFTCEMVYRQCLYWPKCRQDIGRGIDFPSLGRCLDPPVESLNGHWVSKFSLD
jgi:hypothetical protein